MDVNAIALIFIYRPGKKQLKELRILTAHFFHAWIAREQ